MYGPAPDHGDRNTAPASDGTERQAAPIERSRAMTVIEETDRGNGLHAMTGRAWNRLRIRMQRMPLAYKLSLFITLLVVSCMLLLGIILVQQQRQMLQGQINEQGSTLVRLMAQSAKEPLLAEDELALNAIANSFSNSDSVLGTAITSLEGRIIAHAGELHESHAAVAYTLRNNIETAGEDVHAWNWVSRIPGTPNTVITFFHPVKFQDVTAGYALVRFSQSGLKKFVQQAVRAITAATVLIIGLGIGIAFALGRRITQPIDKLVEASRLIGSGDYSFRFSERRRDELGLLMDAFNDMAQGMLEKSQVMSALSRYVSKGVAQEILSNLDDVELGGKKIEGTVLFADIIGFTRIAEEVRPEDLVTMLNRYFSLITCACEINQGIVDKYMGDGAMLVFGAPEPDPEHTFHALRCALLIQKLITRENRLRELQALYPVRFRIGVNTGAMLAGNMGSRQRMEYTVVGDTVNLASRLCSITNGGQIVISRYLYMKPGIRERVLASEYQPVHLRGISEAVSSYLVESLTADYQQTLEDQYQEILRAEKTGVCDA
jgi:adenylate cyclase